MVHNFRMSFSGSNALEGKSWDSCSSYSTRLAWRCNKETLPSWHSHPRQGCPDLMHPSSIKDSLSSKSALMQQYLHVPIFCHWSEWQKWIFFPISQPVRVSEFSDKHDKKVLSVDRTHISSDSMNNICRSVSILYNSNFLSIRPYLLML